MLDLNLINKCLKLSVLQLQVEVFNEIDSTNLEVKRRITKGMDQDLLIISSRQTTGRGRYNRTWFSPEGGLYFSLVLRPRLGPEFAPLSGLLCACAVAEGLQSLGIDNVVLKWPNDVLALEDKISGILNELVTITPVDNWVILGIGINQNISVSDFPEDISYNATSVKDILGKYTSPESLLCSVLNSIDRLLGVVESENSFSSVLKQWRIMSGTLGRKVRIDDGTQTIVGIATELLEDGSLAVNTENGIVNVTIGDVTHLRSD